MKRLVACLFALSFVFYGAAFAQDAVDQQAQEAAAAPAAVSASETVTPQSTNKTLDNLMAAFNGESNASARYTEFAKKADEEGYLGAASLFRAAAKAESIHVDKLKAEIEKLGGKAEAKLETPVVKTTKENLEAAIAGETYESEKMYPEFKVAAELEKQDTAAMIFDNNGKIEAKHLVLYKDALENLEAMKSAKRDFYVCTICGDTETVLPEKCPICFSAKDKFEKVN